MQRVRRFVLVPVMVIWLISQRANAQSIPRPTDAPHAHAAGFNSDRVLNFGCGPAVGWGVVSHEIALPGSLARALSARTGRGTDVDVIADMRINAGSARNWLRRIAVHRYDAIVVMLGANDALPLMPLPRWRTRLSSVLSQVLESTSPDARIFVAGVPPIQSVPGFESRLGAIAGNHAAQMNLVTASLCGESPRTTFVPLSAAKQLPANVSADGRTYRHWASEIADVAALQLVDAR
jgi:lysophospholipase L1-like esterase